jgi:hypothetical protein
MKRSTNDHKPHGDTRRTGGSSRHNRDNRDAFEDEDDRMSVMTQETKFDDDITTESGLAAQLPPEEPFDMTVR